MQEDDWEREQNNFHNYTSQLQVAFAIGLSQGSSQDSNNSLDSSIEDLIHL